MRGGVKVVVICKVTGRLSRLGPGRPALFEVGSVEPFRVGRRSKPAWRSVKGAECNKQPKHYYTTRSEANRAEDSLKGRRCAQAVREVYVTSLCDRVEERLKKGGEKLVTGMWVGGCLGGRDWKLCRAPSSLRNTVCSCSRWMIIRFN